MCVFVYVLCGGDRVCIQRLLVRENCWGMAQLDWSCFHEGGLMGLYLDGCGSIESGSSVVYRVDST